MLMNGMPHINDFSDGLFRRIQLITWDTQFDGKNGNPEPIPDLEKLIAESEMDDFIIWCLQGLQRLIKNKWKFTVADEVEKALDEWKTVLTKCVCSCLRKITNTTLSKNRPQAKRKSLIISINGLTRTTLNR